jgi:hypothetical protein
MIFSTVRRYNVEKCSCGTNGQYGQCTHTLSRKYALHLQEPPNNIVVVDVTSLQRRRDGDVRQKLGDHHCFICNVKCGNAFNLTAHVAGKPHAAQAVKLWQAMRVPDTRTPWQTYILEPTKSQDLARGHVVLLMGDKAVYEVIQGTVSGQTRHAKSSLHTHVVVSTHKEVVLTGGEKVLRVLDGDAFGSPVGRKATTPRTSGTSPMKASRASNVSSGTGKNLATMLANAAIMPQPEYSQIVNKRFAENRATLKSRFPDLCIPKPKPKQALRRPASTRLDSVALLNTSDIAYVVQSLLFSNHKRHRRPMPYNMLPCHISDMQKNSTDGWECAVLNTDCGPGEHWIMAMWDKTPALVVWEMYDRDNSYMEDMVVYLEDQIPGMRVTRHYTGMQPANDSRTCGYNAAFVQLYIESRLSCGEAPVDMDAIPSPPMGWYDLVRDLLCVRDEQLRVLGKVSCQTAAQLGLSVLFKSALDSKRFSLVGVKRQLAKHTEATTQVIFRVNNEKMYVWSVALRPSCLLRVVGLLFCVLFDLFCSLTLSPTPQAAVVASRTLGLVMTVANMPC